MRRTKRQLSGGKRRGPKTIFGRKDGDSGSFKAAKSVSVWLTDTQVARLASAKRRTGWSRSDIVGLLVEHLADQVETLVAKQLAGL